MNTRTTPLPPVELTDPIWTVEHLERALRLGERATRTLIAGPTFPAGFRLTDAPTARRYWLREHVLDHFASLSAVATAPVTAQRRPASRFQGRTPDAQADALGAIAALPTRRARVR